VQAGSKLSEEASSRLAQGTPKSEKPSDPAAEPATSGDAQISSNGTFNISRRNRKTTQPATASSTGAEIEPAAGGPPIKEELRPQNQRQKNKQHKRGMTNRSRTNRSRCLMRRYASFKRNVVDGAAHGWSAGKTGSNPQ
jgi:hypothetical protein